jgi:hypothetical protein
MSRSALTRFVASALTALTLLAFASVSHAAFFDFQAWVANNAEQGFDNSAPFSLTDAGLTLAATAFESDGTPSHVYLDDWYNNIIGGMGVCSALDGDDECAPSSDDNVSDGEVLSWSFSQNITQLVLGLGDDSHFDFNNRDFQYSLDSGTSWTTATTNGNAMVTLLLAGSTGQIDFRAAGTEVEHQFYIRNAEITVIPVPAAVWLFGSGLLGLVGVARRKHL